MGTSTPNPYLSYTIDELELSTRAAHGLQRLGITYIGELVQKNKADLLNIPEFGRKSLNEVNVVLANVGLSLGMEVSSWLPADGRTPAYRITSRMLRYEILQLIQAGRTPDEIETMVSEILIDLHEEDDDAAPDHQDDPQGAQDPARYEGRRGVSR